MRNLKVLVAVVIALSLAACEKFVDGDEPYSGSSAVDGNLVVKAECVATKSGTDGDEGETAEIPLPDRFTRMSMAVYQNDVRVDYVNQTNTDKNFGTMSVDLEPGVYQLVVLAHSGQRSPTTTNCHKISFSNPLTDVFSYYGEVEITAEARMVTVKLTRAVAKIRLTVTDDIPDDVTFFNFICRGTSISMDAATQTGIASSAKRNIVMEKEDGVKTYEIYTFVTGDGQLVDLDVAGYTEDNSVKGGKRFDNVPVSLRKITNITADFFDGIIEGSTTIGVEVDDTWDGTIDYTL